MKRQPDPCFVDNYVDVSLISWLAYIDIQLIFNEYEAMKYMFQYFSKTEDQCSQAMKKAAKEALENNMHKYETKEIIAKAISNHKCSIQEAVYHILPELKRRRIFPAVCFVNTNLPEKRVQVLFPNYQGISQIF